MSLTYSQVLASLKQMDAGVLTFYRGIEKEGLRVKSDTSISQQPHQIELGSALTHPYITTDYSEALLEFITPVKESAKEVLDFLQLAHSFTYQNIDDELIWPASMPGLIEDELDVPIAQYGSSNVGILKHVYRHGLWHRYGRKMQCIAGLHYNFSVSESLWDELAALQNTTADKDFISEGYFGLIRNFRRFSWLLLYLFGASPTLDNSFVKGKGHPLEKKDDDSAYLPFATSLRMSGLGYQNNAQEDLFVCFNSLPTYTQTLQEAMKLSIPAYEKIGLEENGQFKQLNSKLLQIENEYYSDIRPKRNSQNGEKPLTALNDHGVEYIEVRCLDLNPFAPLGIDEEQIHFMDLFLSYCLFRPSPKLNESECAEVSDNQKAVVLEGRKAGFSFKQKGQSISLKDWANDLFADMAQLAKQLDDKKSVTHYSAALNAMKLRIEQPELTPSAQVLAKMAEHNMSFREFALRQAHDLSHSFKGKMTEESNQDWMRIAEKSVQNQKDIESKDLVPFTQYLAQYQSKA